MAQDKRYAVIGAGNGGHAQAAELSLKGRDVVLFDFPQFDDILAPIRQAGGITVTSAVDHFTGGKGEHFAALPNVTSDIAAALDGADVVIVVVPCQYHEVVIAACKGHLKAGQLVVLNPGGVGGSLLLRRALVAEGADGILVAQPSDLLYGGRRSGPAKVNVGAKKKNVALGLFPASDADAVMDIVGDDFPEYRPVDNVLAAGLSGPGMAVHPIPMIMNAVKIDQLGAYTYTSYDITPSVARVIESLDTERLAILAALGIEASSFKDVLNEYYGAEGADFHETVNNVPGYRKQKAPADFQDRYITEEIPTQMVPAALIGNALGVATPILNATIGYASAINGTDYWTEGWTLGKLGLAGMGRDAILDYLRTGEK